MSEETLAYPKQIVEEIGLSVNEINALKRLGCPFYGRKTCVKWVRAWLDEQTGHSRRVSVFGSEPVEHLQHSDGNKYRE